MKLCLAIVVCAGAALLSAAQPAALTYIPIPANHEGTATAINSAGEVVGTDCDPVGPCAVFFWSEKTGFKPIVTVPRFTELPFFLNDKGEVALVTAGAVQLWTARGGLRPVAPAPPDASVAGLNKHGEIAGTGTIAGRMTAFFVSRKGELEPIAPLYPGGTSKATDINDQGEVVGQASYPCDAAMCNIKGVVKSCAGYSCTIGSQLTRTFVWTEKGGSRDIDKSDPSRYMYGDDINDHGEVAGISYATNGPQMAFFASEKSGTAFVSCGRCPAFARLNDRGQVIGWYYFGPYTRTFYWTAQGPIQLIDAFGYRNTQAYAINNRGEVVGYGNTDRDSYGFVWTPSGGVVRLETIFPYAINDKGDLAGSCVGRSFDSGRQPCVLRR